MPLIVSKQVVNMVEIRIELPKLKILTSMVISEDPPISTQSTFDFPYFPLLSPFFFFAFFYGEIPHGFSQHLQANAPVRSWRCRRRSSCRWWARPTPCLWHWVLTQRMMVMKLKGTFGNLLMDYGYIYIYLYIYNYYYFILYIYICGNHVTSPEFINQEVGGTTGSIWSYELRNNNVLQGKWIVYHRSSSWSYVLWFDSTPIKPGPTWSISSSCLRISMLHIYHHLSTCTRNSVLLLFTLDLILTLALSRISS